MRLEFGGTFWVTATELFDEVRGSTGHSSLADFRQIDLPIIQEAIEKRWDNLITEGPTKLALVQGKLFPMYLITCITDSDGTATAMSLEVDPQFNR